MSSQNHPFFCIYRESSFQVAGGKSAFALKLRWEPWLADAVAQGCTGGSRERFCAVVAYAQLLGSLAWPLNCSNREANRCF